MTKIFEFRVSNRTQQREGVAPNVVRLCLSVSGNLHTMGVLALSCCSVFGVWT